jgi:hypothetical protein
METEWVSEMSKVLKQLTRLSRNAYKILVQNASEGEQSVDEKVKLKLSGTLVVDWIQVAWHRVEWF